MAILLADSGATKCEWYLAASDKSTKTVFTQGISPYFFNEEKTVSLLQHELLPSLPSGVNSRNDHFLDLPPNLLALRLFVKKPAADNKPAYKDTSDAASDILRKMMERRRRPS